MSTNLLAQALAVAGNPHSSPVQLVQVLGDLVALGAFEPAEKVIARLRALNALPGNINRLERIVAWLRNLGPQFEDGFLVGAIATANDPKATPEELADAANSLVAWGSLDEADAAIGRLRERGDLPVKVAQLAAASRQLRRSGILQELAAITPQTSLNKPFEVLVRRRPGAGRVVVVFTGFARRFWLSLNALHIFLRKLDSHVIYLNDHSAAMFLNGARSVGPNFHALMETLRAELAKLGDPTVHVLASSAGGYAGLQAAMALKAETFAGMSIRTTLVDDGKVPLSRFERYGIGRCRDPGMIGDLRPLLAASSFPRHIQLFCGDRNNLDRAHAEHLADLPRVDVSLLVGYRPHDAISGLIARGGFQAMLRRFVDPAAERVDRRFGVVPLAELASENVA